MRKWTLIFLLIFMPLQLTWAAASRYCQHESGASALHFGHHADPHALGQLSAQQLNVTDVIDGDCAACHVMAVVIHELVPQSLPDMMCPGEFPVYTMYQAPPPCDAIDRPNWPVLR
ncbi:hypothetical protein KSF73_06630 [Burkholderiaceae bacterium DAT-1]|nr:hypothetical protein [Burkholderiaceae bacterium DAT-1]